MKKIPEVEEERDQLMEEGIIYDDGNKIIFTENYTASSKSTYGTALTRSANLILHGFRNGRDYWRDINGEYLNQNQKI